jgi:hypothetical protein
VVSDLGEDVDPLDLPGVDLRIPGLDDPYQGLERVGRTILGRPEREPGQDPALPLLLDGLLLVQNGRLSSR